MNGTAFSAGGIPVSSALSSATNGTGFGAALPATAGGTLTSMGQVNKISPALERRHDTQAAIRHTVPGPTQLPEPPDDCPQVLFNGNVTGGTALNASAATGTAAMGALGPGLVLVNGTVTNGTGEKSQSWLCDTTYDSV